MQGEQQVGSKTEWKAAKKSAATLVQKKTLISLLTMLSSCWQQIIPVEILQEEIPILRDGGKVIEIWKSSAWKEDIHLWIRTAQRDKEGYKGKIILQTAEGRQKETIKDPAEGKKHAEKVKADEKSKGSQDFGLNV